MTTESQRMMRILQRKEAQHIQIMGDTGADKTRSSFESCAKSGTGKIRP
jgi:ATP-dependent Clp protease ATP-binding subunit ClpA